MSAPLDEDIRQLSNAAGEHYRRYTGSGSPDAFRQAVGMMEQAMALSRERLGAVPAILARNLSQLHLAHYRRDGDRDSLGTAYELLLEASVSDERSVRDVLAETGQALQQAVDFGDRGDAEWYAALYRRLAGRPGEDRFVVWGNFAIALRNLLAHSASDGDHRALAETAERAAGLCPPGSPGHVLVLDYAAQTRLHLAAKGRDPEDARRAATAYESLAEHRPPDTTEHTTDLRRGPFARVLAYELSGEHRDQAAALAALRALAALPVDGLTARQIQDVLASLLRGYRASGDTAVLDAGVEFGDRCLERMDARTDVRYRDLPGLLNTLGLYLIERPSPGRPSARPPIEEARGSEPLPGIAVEFARRLPFTQGPTDVIGPFGKIYLESAKPTVMASWPAHRGSPIEAEAVSWHASALVLPPRSGRGPTPVVVPSCDHRIAVTVTAPRLRAAVIEDVRVHVVTRAPARREHGDVMETTQHLPCPDIDVLLDFEPPVLRRSPAPVTVSPGTTRSVVIRAVAESHEVSWRLELAWRCGRRTGTLTVQPETTGESGFRPLLRAPGHALGPGAGG